MAIPTKKLQVVYRVPVGSEGETKLAYGVVEYSQSTSHYWFTPTDHHFDKWVGDRERISLKALMALFGLVDKFDRSRFREFLLNYDCMFVNIIPQDDGSIWMGEYYRTGRGKKEETIHEAREKVQKAHPDYGVVVCNDPFNKRRQYLFEYNPKAGHYWVTQYVDDVTPVSERSRISLADIKSMFGLTDYSIKQFKECLINDRKVRVQLEHESESPVIADGEPVAVWYYYKEPSLLPECEG